MKTSAQDRLRYALEVHGLREDIQRKIFNYVFAPKAGSRKRVATEMTWEQLKRDIRGAIASTASNRRNWRADYVDIFEDYLKLLRQTRDTIESTWATAMMPDPDAKGNPDAPRVPASVAEISRRARLMNQKNGIDGPTCSTMWQTWIDPAARHAIERRFDDAFIAATGGKGTKPRPFLATNVRRVTKTQLTRLRAFFANQRRILADPDVTARDDTPLATTPYAALQLAAIRMAERAVDAWEQTRAIDAMHALSDPLPVDWRHLLEPAMRERLRKADEQPQLVDLEGIRDFYVEKGPSAAGNGEE